MQKFERSNQPESGSLPDDRLELLPDAGVSLRGGGLGDGFSSPVEIDLDEGLGGGEAGLRIALG